MKTVPHIIICMQLRGYRFKYRSVPLYILLRENFDACFNDNCIANMAAKREFYKLFCRKILLSSLMLCAAAEGGAFEEVQRLIEGGTSPNCKALW